MRDQAIEAMAKAIHEANCLGPHKEKYDHQIVTVALDALLDLIDGHSHYARRLIAVLRGGAE